MSSPQKSSFRPFVHKGYMREFTKLTKRAEKAPALRRVLEQVLSIHEALLRGEEPGVPTTKHGESRIKSVTKYDLASAYRLVIWRNSNVQVPLFIGSHEDTDRWLDTYKGATFYFSTHGKKSVIEYRYGAPDSVAVDKMLSNGDSEPSSTEEPAPLMSIDNACFEGLVPTAEDVDELKSSLRIDMDVSVRRRFLRGFFGSDENRIELVLAAFEHARRGQYDSARMDIWQAAGKVTAANDDADGFARALAGIGRGTQLAEINLGFLDQARRLVEGGSVDDWMLWLVPSQQRIVDAHLNGPARLLGVSGSGKTAVLLHRAVALARRYPGERILVVTLNESLAHYLSHLVDRMCANTGLRPQIHVEPMASVFGNIARLLPGVDPRRIDPRSGETPAMSWIDFAEKHQKMLEPIVSAIEQDDRSAGCDPLQYIREELIWIRSGWGLNERSLYDVASREGRAIPFPKIIPNLGSQDVRGGLPPDTRSRLRKELLDFEDYMHVGQVFDMDGVSVLAHSAIRQFSQSENPESYRCVLVDEYQDISTIELEILNWMVKNPVDGLFVCGDLAQKVFPKHHNNVAAKVNFQGRGFKLEENFRNTREILAAAHALVERFKADAAVEMGTILNPDFAVNSGPRPHLIECADRSEQVEYVCTMVRELFTDPNERSQICVVSHDSATLSDLAARFAKDDIPVLRLSPKASFDTDQPAVRICHLEDVKGFEFKTVFVLDVSDPKRKRSTGIGGDVLREGLPTAGVPWGERWRDAFRLYVAMSRARESLFVCYVFNRSPLIGDLGDLIVEDRACNWIDAPKRVHPMPLPAALSQESVATIHEFGDPLVWGFQWAADRASGASFGACLFPSESAESGFAQGCRCSRCLAPKPSEPTEPKGKESNQGRSGDMTDRYRGWGLGFGGSDDSDM